MNEKFELKKSQDNARGVKDRIFMPFVKIAHNIGLKPIHLTVVAFIFGILSAVSLLQPHTRKWALIFLLLNLFSDGIDGALARYRGKLTKAGWWQDFVADRLVRTGFVIAAIILVGEGEKIKIILLIWTLFTYISLNAIMAFTGRRYHINLDFIFYFLLLINVNLALMFALLETGPGVLVFLYEKVFRRNTEPAKN